MKGDLATNAQQLREAEKEIITLKNEVRSLKTENQALQAETQKYCIVGSCLVGGRTLWHCSNFWRTIMNDTKINCITSVWININIEDVGALLGSSELSGTGIVSVSVIGNNMGEH